MVEVISILNPCIEAMQGTRGRVETREFPPAPGFYAIYLATGDHIGGIPAAAGGLIYVGTSKNLAQRDMGTHFTSGQSGFSTLRRTLGALLKDELDLRAERRSLGPSPTNTQSYRFDSAGEDRLTSWMLEYLEIGYCQHDADRDEFERQLIADLQPPLNQTKWPNPHRQRIKALRAACRDEAKWSSI